MSKMVHRSFVLCKKTRWIDSLRIYAKGGHGGNGCPKNGGIGGPGGDVYIRPSQDVLNLYSVFSKTFRASPSKQRLFGGPGFSASYSRALGSPGKDVELEVPLGIQIIDDRSRVLADLNDSKVKVKIVNGGVGGGPDNGWIGQEGQKRHLRLDLKLIADVGLVGFPNAGKSTILKGICKAKPKIASYPFTTIRPNVGIISYPQDERKISMADLPGLIEGASYNVGMGHRFLKHLERTRLLAIVIDIEGFSLDVKSVKRDAFQTFCLLNKELELYNPDFLRKPAICIVNKMDSNDSKNKFKELEEKIKDFQNASKDSFPSNPELIPEKSIALSRIIPISAKYSPKNIVDLKNLLRTTMDEYERQLQIDETSAEAKLDKLLEDVGP